MNVLVDMKRRSPTIIERKNIVEYANPGKFAELLGVAGADALLVSTDDMEYGGSLGDLKAASKTLRSWKPAKPPAVIRKDLIIHPVQVLLIVNLCS